MKKRQQKKWTEATSSGESRNNQKNMEFNTAFTIDNVREQGNE